MQALLELNSLTKLYGVVLGVNDITLTLPPGVHGLLGPNGAGKSTLMKLITGQLRPSEGTIRVFGEDPWGNVPLMGRIGLCPEQDALYRFMTAREFVVMMAQLAGLPASEVEDRSVATLKLCGAESFMDRKIAEYSRGMRQRTKVAQALVHDPDLIILDEPLTGTDPVGRREMMDLVRQLGESGKSILVSSHVLHEVAEMTSEFVLIYGGRVLASGNVKEIRKVLSDYPHRVTVRTTEVRKLAQRVMQDVPIAGMEIDELAGTVSMLTREPATFYRTLPKAAVELDVKIEELTSQDDNLEAVFKYLTERI
ncbi:MAG: ABC transporter ATP-binding protein [Pirellulales bacterium]|nr:ABC transporter ATP-binding protein [Pirellulales bacterium]